MANQLLLIEIPVSNDGFQTTIRKSSQYSLAPLFVTNQNAMAKSAVELATKTVEAKAKYTGDRHFF